MAVAVDLAFFSQLPELPQVEPQVADVAWLIYELTESPHISSYRLAHVQTVYTQFTPALLKITTAHPGSEHDFRKLLQRKLYEKQAMSGDATEGASLDDLFGNGDQLVVDED